MARRNEDIARYQRRRGLPRLPGLSPLSPACWERGAL